MKATKYMAAMLLMASATGLSAQNNLEKEITIDRDIIPQVHAASRPNLYPRSLKLNRNTVSLSYSDLSSATPFDPLIGRLEPASTLPAVEKTPYRGYVDLGYFPTATVGLSAGYSIIDNDATSLNVWGQFNNNSYKIDPNDDGEKQNVKTLDGKLGIGFSHRFDTAGKLSLGTRFGISSFSRPWKMILEDMTERQGLPTAGQGMISWGIDARWDGNAGENLTYYAGVGFGIFNFSKGAPADTRTLGYPADELWWSPLHQSDVTVDLGVNHRIDDKSSAGIDVNASFLGYNHYQTTETPGPDYSQVLYDLDAEGKTLGLLSFTPYYRFGNRTVDIKAGVRLDVSVNAGKALHIAPDVLLGVNPASGFGAWLRFSGGEEQNRLSTLYDFSRYTASSFAYGYSNIPVKGELGLRLGPVKGLALTVSGAYAAANDWLMPAMADYNLIYLRGDLRSWRASAELSWKYGSLLSIRAGYSTVLGDGEKNHWFEWRDRARHVLSAGLTLSPIKPLTVDVAYELRSGREMPCFTPKASVADDAVPYLFEICDLKNISDLTIGASYRITDAFTVFARVENVLNTKYYVMPMLRGQGITGLAGVGLKF